MLSNKNDKPWNDLNAIDYRDGYENEHEYDYEYDENTLANQEQKTFFAVASHALRMQPFDPNKALDYLLDHAQAKNKSIARTMSLTLHSLFTHFEQLKNEPTLLTNALILIKEHYTKLSRTKDLATIVFNLARIFCVKCFTQEQMVILMDELNPNFYRYFRSLNPSCFELTLMFSALAHYQSKVSLYLFKKDLELEIWSHILEFTNQILYAQENEKSQENAFANYRKLLMCLHTYLTDEPIPSSTQDKISAIIVKTSQILPEKLDNLLFRRIDVFIHTVAALLDSGRLSSLSMAAQTALFSMANRLNEMPEYTQETLPDLGLPAILEIGRIARGGIFTIFPKEKDLFPIFPEDVKKVLIECSLKTIKYETFNQKYKLRMVDALYGYCLLRLPRTHIIPYISKAYEKFLECPRPSGASQLIFVCNYILRVKSIGVDELTKDEYANIQTVHKKTYQHLLDLETITTSITEQIYYEMLKAALKKEKIHPFTEPVLGVNTDWGYSMDITVPILMNGKRSTHFQIEIDGRQHQDKLNEDQYRDCILKHYNKIEVHRFKEKIYTLYPLNVSKKDLADIIKDKKYEDNFITINNEANEPILFCIIDGKCESVTIRDRQQFKKMLAKTTRDEKTMERSIKIYVTEITTDKKCLSLLKKEISRDIDQVIERLKILATAYLDKPKLNVTTAKDNVSAPNQPVKSAWNVPLIKKTKPEVNIQVLEKNEKQAVIENPKEEVKENETTHEEVKHAILSEPKQPLLATLESVVMETEEMEEVEEIEEKKEQAKDEEIQLNLKSNSLQTPLPAVKRMLAHVEKFTHEQKKTINQKDINYLLKEVEQGVPMECNFYELKKAKLLLQTSLLKWHKTSVPNSSVKKVKIDLKEYLANAIYEKSNWQLLFSCMSGCDRKGVHFANFTVEGIEERISKHFGPPINQQLTLAQSKKQQ